MLQSNIHYQSEAYFAQGVKFVEPRSPADCKEYMHIVYPEERKQAQERGLSLVELINKRI